MEERVAIFIDGSNLYRALHGTFGKASINFGKLSIVLVGDRKLVRTYYYGAAYAGNHPKAREQQAFFDKLRMIPYLEVRLGKLRPKGRELVQKGVDVNLAVNMIDFAFRDTYDTAILVSGDSDFRPAVEMVKNLGKHVELAVVKGQPHFQLASSCDKTTILDETLLDPCWLNP